MATDKNHPLTYEQLKAFLDRDPDGGTVEPTDADYKRFEAEIVEVGGPQALVQYYSNWDDPKNPV